MNAPEYCVRRNVVAADDVAIIWTLHSSTTAIDATLTVVDIICVIEG